MKFNQLILEFDIVDPFNDVINSLLDSKEDHQVVIELLNTKENFWKAYHMAQRSGLDFTLDEWTTYIKEVLHGHVDDYFGQPARFIVKDFTWWLDFEHKPETKDRDFSEYGL